MVETRMLPRVLTVRVDLPSSTADPSEREPNMSTAAVSNIEELMEEWATSDNKVAAFKSVENAFNSMLIENCREESAEDVIEPGNPAEIGTEQPGYPARFSEGNETAVKSVADLQPGLPARSVEAERVREYTCFNCNSANPGHSTSQCRRNQGRRFQRRDGERSERFQLFIREKETAMRRIEHDRTDEDSRIRGQRDDEVRAERRAREERYRREDRELAERRRRQDRLWEEVWDEKVRVYRSSH